MLLARPWGPTRSCSLRGFSRLGRVSQGYEFRGGAAPHHLRTWRCSRLLATGAEPAEPMWRLRPACRAAVAGPRAKASARCALRPAELATRWLFTQRPRTSGPPDNGCARGGASLEWPVLTLATALVVAGTTIQSARSQIPLLLEEVVHPETSQQQKGAPTTPAPQAALASAPPEKAPATEGSRPGGGSKPAPAPPRVPAPQPGSPRAPGPVAAGPKPPGGRTGSISMEQEMLKHRRIFITGEINDECARAVAQCLMFFQDESPDAAVTMFINSGGGLVHSGLAIVDLMHSVSTPLHTVAYGRCHSIAVFLLLAGTPGHRLAYENTRFMIHEPSCSYQKLQTTDINLKVEELGRQKRSLERLLSAYTGRPVEDIADIMLRDRYFSADEAVDFGLLDGVVPQPRRASASPGPSASGS